MSTCSGGSFTINALQPGNSYTGPAGIDVSDMCRCNTVSYSLLSACDACQGSEWRSWTEYSFNCTKTLPASTFPNPVPAGTRVSNWALLDVTVQDNWNVNDSNFAGGTPEKGPGVVISPSGVSTAARATGTATRSTSPSPGSLSNGGSSSSNTGAIACSVVEGILVVSIASVANFFFLRWRRLQTASTPLTAQPQIGQSQRPLPLSDSGTFAPSSAPAEPTTPMMLYDPSDPTTFPRHQAVPPNSPAFLAPRLHRNGSRKTLGTMHTSWAPGYHSLPAV